MMPNNGLRVIEAAVEDGRRVDLYLGGLPLGSLVEQDRGVVDGGGRLIADRMDRAIRVMVEERLAEAQRQTTALRAVVRAMEAGGEAWDDATLGLAKGDRIQYRRNGVGIYECEVIEVVAWRSRPLRLRPISCGSATGRAVQGKDFWASRANVRRVVALAPMRGEVLQIAAG